MEENIQESWESNSVRYLFTNKVYQECQSILYGFNPWESSIPEDELYRVTIMHRQLEQTNKYLNTISQEGKSMKNVALINHSIDIFKVDFDAFPTQLPKAFPQLQRMRLILIKPIVAWGWLSLITILKQLIHLQYLQIFIDETAPLSSLKWIEQINNSQLTHIIKRFQLCVYLSLKDPTLPIQQQNLVKLKKVHSIPGKFLNKLIDTDGQIIRQATKLQKWQCITLLYRGNILDDCPLYFFTQIAFTYLHNLHLVDNQMRSLQPISRIRAPNLQNINLGSFACYSGGNQLHQLMSLSKIQSSKIKMIKLDGNYFNELESIATGNFQPLRQIQVQGFIETRQRNQCYTVRCLAKMQLLQNVGINIQSYNRIMQNLLLDCIKRKTTKSTIWAKGMIF